MRLEVDIANSVAPPPILDNITPFESDGAKAKEYLNAGVRAAQAGDRSSAKNALLKASELDPQNANVWLWLASISEYPEELMVFVDNVLGIDPANERALQWRSATSSLLAKTFVQRGTDAAESDQAMYAEDCFTKALEFDPKNATAMLWLASLADDHVRRLTYLQRVLEVEPDNKAAQNALRNISIEEEQVEFSNIKRVAAEGSVDDAVSLLSGFTVKHPANVDGWMMLSHLSVKPADKLAALKCVLEIDPKNAAAKVSFDSLNAIFAEVKPVEEPSPESVEVEAFAKDNADPYQDYPVENRQFEPPVSELVEEVINESAFAPVEVEAFENQDADLYQDAVENVEFEAPISEPVEELVFEPVATEIPATIAVNAENAAEFFVPEWQPSEPEQDWDRKTVAYSAEDFIIDDLDPQPTKVVEEFTFEEMVSIPMPVDMLDESAAIQPERTGFETVVAALEPEVRSSATQCPFCSTANDEIAFVCNSCFAALTLSDLELVLNNGNADKYLIRKAVDAMESERSRRDFNEAELTTLGIGHLNLRNLQFGYDRLQEASRLNPDNIILSSQLNSLLIRMEEIKRQDEVHASMATGKKILVVDDSATIRKLIAGKLEKCGHQVFLSDDGVAAMEHLEDLLPDLILLDITMPRMDGYETCRQIRGRVSTANIPVVMISGKDGFFDKVRGRMAGTTGYITKPFGPETLMKAIEFYLGGGQDLEGEVQAVETSSPDLDLNQPLPSTT